MSKYDKEYEDAPDMPLSEEQKDRIVKKVADYVPWPHRACQIIGFLRSVIRSGEQLTAEDDAMIDAFLGTKD